MHWKSGFSEEEWKEIEQVVNSYQTYQPEGEGMPNSIWSILLIIAGGVGLVFTYPCRNIRNVYRILRRSLGS